MVKFSEYIWPARKGIVPYEHQKETTKFLLTYKNAYVLNEMGTGKTMSALWASDFLMINDRVRRVLIVGPLSTLQSVWGREIFMNFPHHKYRIAHGTKEYRKQCIESNIEFIIINHDGVVTMEEDIIRAKFDIIIIDELTAFKTASTNRSRSMQRIARKSKAVWGMSGNPTANGPLTAFGQCKVVNPDNPFLPRFYSAFRDMVCIQITPFLWGPKHDAEKTIFKIMQPAIRYRREDCLDLPEMVFETLEVPLSRDQNDAYQAMKAEMLVEYNEGNVTAQSAATRLVKLLQISSGGVKDEYGAIRYYDIDAKMNMVKEIFEETPQKKLVIFCMFRATCERVTEELVAKKYKAALIYGSTDQKMRGRIIQDFQEGDLEIIVAQIAAISHGVTLTAASTIVYWDLTPSLEQYEQACARVKRIGQKFKQLVIHLVSSQADKHILGIITRKEKFSNKVLELYRIVATE
jgi:SNF2 family DNA or RNA helicase